MTDFLGNRYPNVAAKLRKVSIASLPTPVTHHDVRLATRQRRVLVKHDDLSNVIYGGNKVRKLEYLLQRAIDRNAERVATFGAAGSNHALATAIHAKRLGLECTCFLAHQKPTPNIEKALCKHLEIGTELLRYGGSVDKLALFRRYLQGRNAWVIPLGGSCWLGAVGFVNAGLELAEQIAAGELDTPDRIYIANGTMGSVAGLTIGLALADMPIEIHAVRVADNRYARRVVLNRLIAKTAFVLNRIDNSIPADLRERTRIVWRDEFFAGGYAAVDDRTEQAVDFASKQLNLRLDTTYTGKAMAALLHDLAGDNADARFLFWNTYNSRPLPILSDRPLNLTPLPSEFKRYFG